MQTIKDLLARDLSHPIEEIIKVDQADEQTVYAELTEYVATDRIKGQYRDILSAMAEAPAEPHEGVGIWVSGFFGSGKSSFAKNLGYVLANPTVLGKKSSDLFKQQVGDRRLSDLVDFVNQKIPTEAVMFDVSVDRAVRTTTERIAEVMYTVLLRELGYAEDYDVAELEIELEKEGKLDDFVARCQKMYGADWRAVRKGAQKISRASAILHAMDPGTYPTADSWAQSLLDKRADITVGKFVDRTFELTSRRRPGKALTFIIDEVGQYVARSADKIEDLRAVVEQFGKVSKNLVKAHKAPAPVWVLVTSQEKLDEVVAAIDSKRVELAKLQDRFKYRIDLAPADIREVATRRVLAKQSAAVPVLKKLFADSQGQLNAAIRLERTARKTDLGEADFVQFYPYLPHFIELSIDIMSGIRLQPGAPRHLGGSNRTIIKQAYEMLVSPRTALAEKPVGTLVTMDRIYELIEASLSSEKQKDISDIAQRFKNDSGGKGMIARVARTVCLLEFVRDLPRTEANIAACLVDEVGKSAPLAEVQNALKDLEKAQFIRNTEDGWKLQTAQEKSWDTERRSFAPKPKDRNEMVREGLKDIFGEPNLRTYRFRNLRNFKVGISVDGVGVDEGQVQLSIITADDAATLPSRVEETRHESRQQTHQNDIYWVFALTPDADDLVTTLYQSREMVKKYDQLRAQNRITNEEAASLVNEKNEALRYLSRLREKMTEALNKGQGLFRGVSRDAAFLGKTTGEVFKSLFDLAAPDLYPKLEMGARPLKGTEAEEILKAANLSGLPQVFYAGDQGLNLVVKEGARFVVNPNANVAKEVLDYLNKEFSYGNKDSRTGKAVESHFGGLGYGWELDILRLVLATLFRGGSIEITHGGRRFDSYQEAQSRTSFVNTPAFRSTLFTAAKPIDLPTLVEAVKGYEELSGSTVDVDKNAIAVAFKRLAEDELKRVLVVEARVKANSLPALDEVAEYRETLAGVHQAAADECVRILAGQGKSLKEEKERLRKIDKATTDQGVTTIRLARVASRDMWPILELRGSDGQLGPKAQQLEQLLDSVELYDSLSQVEADAKEILSAYDTVYTQLHQKRAEAFGAAIDDIKGRPEWPQVMENMRAPILSALASRACQEADVPPDATVCRTCNATMSQMDSDLAALGELKARAIARIQELTAPKEKVERVKLAGFFTEALDSDAAVETAVERLRDHLMKLVAEGAKIILE